MHNLFASLLILLPTLPLVSAAVPKGARTPRASKRAATAKPKANLPKVTCASRFDTLLAMLKDPANVNSVGAESTVLNASGAFAEYTHPCPRSRGDETNYCTPTKRGSAAPFVVTGGISKASSVGGVSYVAAPPEGSPKQMTFFLLKKNGKVRLRWLLDGKTHESRVDSCSGNYWTSATAGSAVAVHLDKVTKTAEPPH